MQAMKSGEARGIGHVWIGTFRVKEVGGCFGWGDIGLRKLHALRQPQHTADFVALMRLEKFPDAVLTQISLPKDGVVVGGMDLRVSVPIHPHVVDDPLHINHQRISLGHAPCKVTERLWGVAWRPGIDPAIVIGVLDEGTIHEGLNAEQDSASWLQRVAVMAFDDSSFDVGDRFGHAVLHKLLCIIICQGVHFHILEV
jgi:hypothetical protein